MCWYHADHDKKGIRMVIIVCLDQKNGMRFNHRRLSRDREIIKDIYKMLLDAPLYMSSQSQILFEDYDGKIVVDPKFMEKSDMFCFVETSDFDTHKVDEIIVCDDGSTDNTVEILKDYPVTVYQNEKI